MQQGIMQKIPQLLNFSLNGEEKGSKMKKIIIAAMAVSFAACAQAVVCNWGSSGIQIDGDFDFGEGNYANNFLVYLVSADSYSQSDVATGIKSATSVSTYLSSVATGSATTAADGSFVANFDLGDKTAYNAFLVILDANAADSAEYMFVSDTYAATVGTVQGTFDYDGDTWVNALGYDTKGTAGSNWQAIPEPTSGLLLLLGVAGLALKRKRA